jgi:hypothetical protein
VIVTRSDKHPAPPKVATIAANVRLIEQMLAALDREYAEVYDFAYTVGLPQPEFGRGKPHSSVSDPTGETTIATAKQRARRAAYVASEKIADAAGQLRAANDALAHALPDPERITPGMELYPRTASNDDVSAAREAQERRRERGEL